MLDYICNLYCVHYEYCEDADDIKHDAVRSSLLIVNRNLQAAATLCMCKFLILTWPTCNGLKLLDQRAC